MPTQNISDKKMAAIITAGMNNTPSSEALMKHHKYRKDDESRIYRQLPRTSVGIGLSPASSLSGSSSCSGMVTPMFVAPSNLDPKSDYSKSSPNHISKTQWCAVAILTFINLINYMDRYTIAGILTQVQEHYHISDSEAGFLQTIFVLSYMIFAPIFGFLGDRYSRKWIMAVGVGIWVLAVLVGSFMENFTAFLVMRAIVGVGEASYSTIAPTIISDMFVKDARSKMLALFYFAIPVGSGLGYVVGQGLSSAFGEWQYSMRGTPVLGTIAVLLIIFALVDPPRGEAEGQENLKPSSYYEDLKCLTLNKSFVLSTLGFTCVAFCTGALAWWGPKFLETSVLAMEVSKDERAVNIDSIAFVFGVMTMVAGIMGVPLGALLSTKLKVKFPRADPVICGVGLSITAFFFLLSLIWAAETSIIVALVLIFVGEISLNLNWSIVADMLLYVVAPTRRGTAEALQILISHALGDAGSPFLIGVTTDLLKNHTVSREDYCVDKLQFDGNQTLALPGNKTTTTRCQANIDFYSMQYSLVINVAVVAAGALFFFLTAIWIVQDKLRAENRETEVDKKNTGSGETKEMLGIVECGDLDDFIDDDDIPPTMVITRSEIKPLNQNSTHLVEQNCKAGKASHKHSSVRSYSSNTYEKSDLTYDQRFSTLQLNEAMEQYSPTSRRAKPDMKVIHDCEGKAALGNSGYQPLNLISSTCTFQRLLDSPDTSSEKLDEATGSSNSSSSPSPPTLPKILKA